MTTLAAAAGWGLGAAAFVAYNSHFVGGWAAVLGRRRSARVARLDGKVVVLTGATGGIGAGLVRELTRAGATVVLLVRSVSKGECIRSSLSDSTQAQVEVLEMDLASLASIRKGAEALLRRHPQRLDVLILNGAVGRSLLGSGGFRRTADGFEEMIGINFLGHFYLTQLLLPVLQQTPGARVIAQSSLVAVNTYAQGVDTSTWAARPDYFDDWAQYGQSKLALLVFMQQLQQRAPSLLCLSCHPGVVQGTTLTTHIKSEAGLLERCLLWFSLDVLAMRLEDGWRTTLYLVGEAAEELTPGGFYVPLGRLSRWPWHRAAVAYLRLASFQNPFTRPREAHPALWEDATAALRQAGAKI